MEDSLLSQFAVCEEQAFAVEGFEGGEPAEVEFGLRLLLWILLVDFYVAAEAVPLIGAAIKLTFPDHEGIPIGIFAIRLIRHITCIAIHEKTLILPIVPFIFRYVLYAPIVYSQEILVIIHSHDAGVFILFRPMCRRYHQEIQGVDGVVVCILQHGITVEAQHFIVILLNDLLKVWTNYLVIIANRKRSVIQ